MKKRNKKIAMAALAAVMGFSQSVMFADLTPVKAAEDMPVNVLSDVVTMETDLPTYEATFGIPQSAIISIKNNAGNYGSSVIGKAIDGTASTHWETNKANSASFHNVVIITFDDVYDIAKMRYTARQNAGNKGFPYKYKLYYSTSETGNDFELLKEGSLGVATGQPIDIDFEPTAIKRIQFEFVEAKEGWASIGELNFYTFDKLGNEIPKIFANGICTVVADAYKDTAKIEQLKELAQQHPNREQYLHVLDEAMTLIQNPNAFNDRIVTLSPRGKMNEEQARTHLNNGLYAYDTTGYYIQPEETIYVYNGAEEGEIQPKIVFAQIAWNNGSWIREYALKPGLNTITAPTRDKMNPAAIYVKNESLTNVPEVRISGGHKYPRFVLGQTTTEEFQAELQAYLQNVTYNDADFDNGNPNGYDYNIAEYVSENVIISTSAEGALKEVNAVIKSGKTVDYHMQAWESMYDSFAEYSGFEMNDPNHPDYRPRGKFNPRVFETGPWAWSGWGYTGYDGEGSKRENGFYPSLLRAPASGGWAIPHEFGHNYDSNVFGVGESTNNLYSLMVQDQYLDKNRMEQENRWHNHFTNYHNTKVYPNDQLFYGAIVYQLQPVFGNDIYGKASRIARENMVEDKGAMSGLSSRADKLAVAISLAAGYDLMDHFSYYGLNITDEGRAKVTHLPKYDKKTYYVNNKSFEADAAAFEDNTVKPTITAATQAGSNQITLNVNIDQPENSILLYEIYRDGEYLGVTYGDYFVDKTAEANQTYAYSVIAYDRKLNPSPSSDDMAKNASEPNIVLNGSQLVELRSEFNPLDLVKGFSATNEDITSSVQVVSNTVDTGKAGTYEVSYTLVDSVGNTTAKTIQVEVVSQFQYASDVQEQSVNVGWGSLNKDKNMQNARISLTNGTEEIVYDKGLTAHAASEVVYNIANQGYTYFESFVGIDKHARNSQANAKFEVWVDGVKQFDSGAMRGTTAQKYVKVSLAGASELKLVTDSLGANTSDHTVWAGARFASSESYPTIQASDIVLEENAVADFNQILAGVTASDIEDGDLTSAVTYTTDYVAGATGGFTITYAVTDSAGNTTTKTVNLMIINDFVYASDVPWKSANAGYGSVQRDVATSGLQMKLYDGTQNINFEKGLGTHATSTITYDLTGKNYGFFTSTVGVDRNRGNGNSSIQFQVYVDGQLVDETPVMNINTPFMSLKADLANARELTLVVTDAGNGIANDHANWADAKFLVAGDAVLPEPEQTPEQVAAEQIGIIKAAVEAAVATVDITQIDQVYYMKPAFPGYVSNETDTAIVAMLEATLAEMSGEILVDLSNTAQENGQRITGVYQDIPSLVENRLMIMYRADAESPYYMYMNGQVSPYGAY